MSSSTLFLFGLSPSTNSRQATRSEAEGRNLADDTLFDFVTHPATLRANGSGFAQAVPLCSTEVIETPAVTFIASSWDPHFTFGKQPVSGVLRTDLVSRQKSR